MPCFNRIFQSVFEKARNIYQIEPNNEDKRELEGLLKKKIEELSNKSIQSHEELKSELIRIKQMNRYQFMMIEKWVMEQLLRIKQSNKDPKAKKKKKVISLHV